MHVIDLFARFAGVVASQSDMKRNRGILSPVVRFVVFFQDLRHGVLQGFRRIVDDIVDFGSRLVEVSHFQGQSARRESLDSRGLDVGHAYIREACIR